MSTSRTPPVMVAALVALASASRLLAQAPDDAVGRAMHDELARSIEQLHLDQLERPYFISYAVHEHQSLIVSASAGSLVTLDSTRARLLSVEVRVGDYKFDNMNFFSTPSFGLGTDVEEIEQGLELPLEDNYLELRRQMWLATDAGYKRAAAALAAKRAALANESRPDSLPDFTREPVNHMIDERPVPHFTVADLESLARDASRATARPGMFMSSATVSVEIPRTRYLSSEGSSYSRVSSTVMVSATTSTQADDGMPLAATIRFRAPSIEGLPRRAQMLAEIGEMCARLDSLRHAPMQERYNGPVLFQGRAAAELFSEAFAPALVGRRRIMAASPQMEVGLDRVSDMMGGGASFSDKLGGRVLPEFLSVTDDPSAGSLIAYKVDEEGVPSRVTNLVESGILKTLLTTRTPVPGVGRSTGSRHGGMAVPSNMLVRTEKGASDQALVAQLLSMVQKRGLPYGIIVREVGALSTGVSQQSFVMAIEEGSARGSRDRELRLAYRVYPDGRQEMVRGARATGLDAQAFKDIVAAGATPTIYYHVATEIRAAMGMSGFMSGGGIPTEGTPLGSYSVPSLLFDDLTLTGATRAFPTLPLSAPPEAGN